MFVEKFRLDSEISNTRSSVL